MDVCIVPLAFESAVEAISSSGSAEHHSPIHRISPEEAPADTAAHEGGRGGTTYIRPAQYVMPVHIGCPDTTIKQRNA